MAQISFPAQTKVAPSFSEPNAIVDYAQQSGFVHLFQGDGPTVRIGSGDLNVYINTLQIRTQSQTSQFAPNFLPSASIVGSYIQTQTYNVQTRVTYGPEDTQAAANYDQALPSLLNLASRQGIFQGLRTMALYGVVASNNEGLLNTPSATQVTLPADSYGNTAVQTYDNGEMADFLRAQVVSLVTSMYQTGPQASGRVVFISPQRVGMQFSVRNIVQVTSYQRPGAGTETTMGVTANVLRDAGYTMEWYYDDTLIGKGAGGSDMVLLTMPEIQVPTMPGINTDEFGRVRPSLNAVNLMYADMAAPMRVTTPIPDGGVTEIQRLRASCGWCVRPQGLFQISMPYSAS